MFWVLFSYGPGLNPLNHPDYTAQTESDPNAVAAELSVFGDLSRNLALGAVGYLETIYDPTNGTISDGIVPRVGP